MSAVHREADEHQSLGRVSRVSTKKGRLSDLLYDTIQERTIEQQKEDDLPQTVHCIEEDDDKLRYIQEVLDNQALDLDANYDDYKILDSD